MPDESMIQQDGKSDDEQVQDLAVDGQEGEDVKGGMLNPQPLPPRHGQPIAERITSKH